MISQICEAFGCPPDVAMRQDVRLCMDIIVMRQYAELSSMEASGAKLSGHQMRFLFAMEQMAEGS